MANTTEALNKAARALADHSADVCGVNREDNWKLYSEDFIEQARIALTAASAEAATPDELRRAVRLMTESLNNREWAEHVSTDEDAQALEVAITDLVGKTAPQASQPIGQLSSEVDTYWRPLLEQKTAELVQLRQKYADLASNSQPVSGAMTDEQIVDEVVTGLYRRFKDWSKRGFGPDDVTWCEVKADVVALLSASGQAGQKAVRDDRCPECGLIDWRDFWTGTKKTHDVCASCGHRRSLASTATERSEEVTPAQQTEAPVNVPDMQPVISSMRATLSAIANTLDDDELRAAAKQAYDDSFEQERKLKTLAAAPAPVQTEAPSDANWISTDDKLPEETAVCLVTGWAFNDPTKGRYLTLARFSKGAFYEELTGDYLYFPTHWMVTPELPSAAIAKEKANQKGGEA